MSITLSQFNALSQKVDELNTLNIELSTKLNDLYNIVLHKEFNIFYTKLREVSTPIQKNNINHFKLYIPINLHITDFICNIDIYENIMLVNKTDIYSPVFILRNTTGKYDFTEKLIKFYKFDEDHTTIKYQDCDTGQEVTEQIKNFILDNNTYVYKIILKATEKVYIPFGIKFNLPQKIFFTITNSRYNNSLNGLLTLDYVISDINNQLYVLIANVCNNSTVIMAGESYCEMALFYQPIISGFTEFVSL